MIDLYLVRHGETSYNLNKLIQGITSCINAYINVSTIALEHLGCNTGCPYCLALLIPARESKYRISEIVFLLANICSVFFLLPNECD